MKFANEITNQEDCIIKLNQTNNTEFSLKFINIEKIVLQRNSHRIFMLFYIDVYMMNLNDKCKKL
jgi:hypothetical protein